MELDPALGAEQRRPDRSAEIEVEARRAPVGRLADQPGTGNAAASDDAIGLDAIDERAGMAKRR